MHTSTVLLIGDDRGKPMTRAYGEIDAFVQPLTPCQSFLAAIGRRFEQFYTKPVCAPTRFALFSGRDPNRTGVGTGIPSSGPFRPIRGELMLPRLLRDGSDEQIRCGLFGKYHMGVGPPVGNTSSPNERGWNEFAGNLDNIPSYRDWPRVHNGVSTIAHAYHTSKIVNDALAWHASVVPAPTFLTVAFQAPHEPLHVPPEGTYQTPVKDPDSAYQKSRAMIETMDFEMFRLLSGIGFLAGDYFSGLQIGPEFFSMNVIYIDDNGTARGAFPPDPVDRHGLPLDPTRSKGWPTQLGVNNACIAAGRDVVQAGPSYRLITCEDLWRTIAELMAIDVDAVIADSPLQFDSVSFKDELAGTSSSPGRLQVVTQQFTPIGPNPGTAAGRYAIIGERLNGHQFKIVRITGNDDEFFDVYEGQPGEPFVDPQEKDNLLASGPLNQMQRHWYMKLRAEFQLHFTGIEPANSKLWRPSESRSPVFAELLASRVGTVAGRG